jgi:hypothetical protein
MLMNASQFHLGRSVRIGSLVASSLLLLLAPAIAAQDDENEAHPAHIHSGTCEQLGDVVFPLADVVTQTGEEMGAAGGHPVKLSEVNHVDVPLQEILDGEHAINVHLSAEEIGTYIACGTIGGVVHERENGEGMEITISLIEPEAMGTGGAAEEATPVA